MSRFPRRWPWSRRHVCDAPPQIVDGRGEAWDAYNAAQQRLRESRALTDRVRAVAAELREQREMNHFAERMKHAFEEYR